jgi:prepilin-type processing-associated H-X9-DG protein
MDYRTNSLGGRMDYELSSGLVGQAGRGPMRIDGTNWTGERIVIPYLCIGIYDFPDPETVGYANPQLSPHGDGFNAWFTDGHAAWVKWEEADDVREGKSPYWKWGRS